MIGVTIHDVQRYGSVRGAMQCISSRDGVDVADMYLVPPRPLQARDRTLELGQMMRAPSAMRTSPSWDLYMRNSSRPESEVAALAISADMESVQAIIREPWRYRVLHQMIDSITDAYSMRVGSVVLVMFVEREGTWLDVQPRILRDVTPFTALTSAVQQYLVDSA